MNIYLIIFEIRRKFWILSIQICDFMLDNKEDFAHYKGMANEMDKFDKFVEIMRRPSDGSRVRKLEEWATDSEITAFASMTSTPIFTFYEGQWRVYNPIGFYKDDMFAGVNQLGIYLNNPGVHFEPVLSMVIVFILIISV